MHEEGDLHSLTCVSTEYLTSLLLNGVWLEMNGTCEGRPPLGAMTDLM